MNNNISDAIRYVVWSSIRKMIKSFIDPPIKKPIGDFVWYSVGDSLKTRAESFLKYSIQDSVRDYFKNE